MDYTGDNVYCSTKSELKPEVAEQLIGKTIRSIQAFENIIIIGLTDFMQIEVEGHTYTDSPLTVVAGSLRDE